MKSQTLSVKGGGRQTHDAMDDCADMEEVVTKLLFEMTYSELNSIP